MMSSNLSSQPNPQIPKVLIFFLGFFALVGFLDASYLTFEHYRGTIPPCSIVSGCETVLTSSYSVVVGIPLALLGALFYFSLLMLVLIYVDSAKRFPLLLIRYQVIIGFLVSCGLVYVQLFVLHAICLYCMVSVFSSSMLFILGFPLSHYLAKGEQEVVSG